MVKGSIPVLRMQHGTVWQLQTCLEDATCDCVANERQHTCLENATWNCVAKAAPEERPETVMELGSTLNCCSF
jgi:hypothetical protein